jgi:tRNA pseudouridine55 synthase
MITLWKKLYETPLASLERLRLSSETFKNERLSYAGRLDPMAEGVMPVMVGDECEQRDIFLGFDKTYETEIFFGLSTDSFDLLGLVTGVKPVAHLTEDAFGEAVTPFLGDIEQVPPQFSSGAISKGLDKVREGKVDIKKKKVEVISIGVVSMNPRTVVHVAAEGIKAADMVVGDFRQSEIKARWNEILKNNGDMSGVVVSLKIESGTGFYVRAFARDMGEALGVPACVLRIVRTEAGDWGKKDCVI